MIKLDTDTERLFALYPHLRAIESTWGSRECREFLARLMFDDRSGARHGFDPAAASTVMALLEEHDIRFPQYCDQQPETLWSDDPLGSDRL